MEFVEPLMITAKLWISKAKNFVILWKLYHDIMTQTNNELNLKTLVDDFILVYQNLFQVKQNTCQLQLPNWKLFYHIVENWKYFLNVNKLTMTKEKK